MIEIEGLPKGWKPVSYGWPKKNVDYVFDGIGVKLFIGKEDHALLIVEKIQPRRIVLEKTEEKHLGCQTLYIDDTEFMIMTDKVWREVKETDTPLNKEEPKLSLSVNDCKSLLSTNDNYASYHKIKEFIKDK